jgi:hypothetical protein
LYLPISRLWRNLLHHGVGLAMATFAISVGHCS